MNEPMMYHHKGALVRLGRDAILKSLAETEAKLRTGKFAYTEQQVFQSQVKEIQTVWPEAPRDFMRQIVKGMTPTGQNISPATIRTALYQTFENFICPKRAEVSQSKPEYQFREACADIAMSTLFRRAPSGDLTPIQQVRRYTDNGRLIKIKLSSAPLRLVVNCDELEKSDGTEKPGCADLYVQAYFCPALKSAMLLGYAYKADVRAASKGNKHTDNANCAWDKMAYHMPMAKLRPMADFLAQDLDSKAGIKEFPQGIVFERVPAPEDLPVLGKRDIQNYGKGESPETFDFLASCGITSAKKQEPAVQQPKSEQKTADKELEL